MAIATLFGAFAAACTFLPRISISSTPPIDSKDPFSTSFSVINTGIIPLHNVTAYVSIGQITVYPAHPDNSFVPTFDGGITRSNWENHTLSMDERFDIVLNDLFKSQEDSLRLTGADIAIIIRYTPWFIPIKRTKKFRFVGKEQADKKLYWYSFPIE